MPTKQAPVTVPAKQNSALSPTPSEQKQAQAGSKYAQEYLQKLKENQKESQKFVMDLYKLLERGKAKEALEKFKQQRTFFSQYVDAEVFNVLEQSIMQSIMESQSASAKVSGAAQPDSGKKVSPDQERVNRINGLIRENKIEAAYAEFKRSEKQLKNAMPKDDFKLLKTEVENSYKTYKNNNK